MSLLAFVFPGQGAQKRYMGKDFYETYPIARQTFEEANDLLGWNVSSLCFSGSDFALSQTRATQVSVFVVEMAILKSIQNEGLGYPSFFAGHSLGEYSALVASGALSFSEGIRIVSKRGQLMEEACQVDHGMLAVSGISVSKVEALCEDFGYAGLIVDCACYNGPEQCVLSGELSVLSKAADVLAKWGAKTDRLKVSGAFHSRWMKPKAHAFRDELKKVVWGKMNNRVISNVSGEPYPDDKLKWIELLTTQLFEPVNWVKSVRFLYLRGVRRFIEIGPGNVLSQLNRAIMPSIEAVSVSQTADVKGGLELVSKTSAGSIALAFIARVLAHAAATRNSDLNNSGFDEYCRRPYFEVLSLYKRAKAHSHGANAMDCKRAAEMLKQVLETKGVPQELQEFRWRELSWIDPYHVLTQDLLGSKIAGTNQNYE